MAEADGQMGSSADLASTALCLFSGTNDARLLGCCALVCRSWAEAAQTPLLWEAALERLRAAHAVPLQVCERLPSSKLQVHRELGLQHLAKVTPRVLHKPAGQVEAGSACFVPSTGSLMVLDNHHLLQCQLQPSLEGAAVRIIPTTSPQHPAPTLLALGPAGTVITGHPDGQCRVWCCIKRAFLSCSPIEFQHKGGAKHLATDEDIIVSSGLEGDVCIWRLTAATTSTSHVWQLLAYLKQPTPNAILQVCVSADHNRVALLTARTVEIFDCDGTWQHTCPNMQNSSCMFVGDVLVMASTASFTWPYATSYELHITLLHTHTGQMATLVAPPLQPAAVDGRGNGRGLCRMCSLECVCDLETTPRHHVSTVPPLTWMRPPTLCFTSSKLIIMPYQALAHTACSFPSLLHFRWEHLVQAAGLYCTSVPNAQQPTAAPKHVKAADVLCEGLHAGTCASGACRFAHIQSGVQQLVVTPRALLLVQLDGTVSALDVPYL